MSISSKRHPQVEATVTLVWDQNHEPDLAGYRAYWGTAPGQYNIPIEVTAPCWTLAPTTGHEPCPTVTITGLVPGTTYFFAVTAFNDSQLESIPSKEISYTPPL